MLIANNTDVTAQMMRILEINIAQHPAFKQGSEAGKMIFHALHENHGHIGREIVKRLIKKGKKWIKARIEQHMREFPVIYKCKFAGDERFWEVSIVLADLMGRLAYEWGLIKFDPKSGTEWALAQIGAIRRAVTDNKFDAFDLISEYLNEHANSTIVAMHSGKAAPMIEHTRLPKNEVRARVDMFRDVVSQPYDRGVVLFERTYLRKWLAQRGADYRAFIEGMEAESVLANPRGSKAYLAKDTAIKIGQSYVVGVNLNHPRLKGFLSDKEAEADSYIYGNLRLI
jgi:hypothetical protein